MNIAVGCDHAGIEASPEIQRLLTAAGHQVSDCGTHGDTSVDYPDFAAAVAQKVAAGDANLGILICGTGIGMSIAANKVTGVRAAKVNDPFEARMCREHNNANVLCLGARVLDPSVMEEIVMSFVDGTFAGGRHGRRVDKMMGLEAEA
ncbi:MAG: ribose 5-phosphate isomerase B [Pseudohongiellaceae bacterium]|jgi:ribose 5-phosphate isomerase B